MSIDELSANGSWEQHGSGKPLQDKREKTFKIMFVPNDAVIGFLGDKVTIWKDSLSSLLFLTFFPLTLDQVISIFTYFLDDFVTVCKVI